METKTPGLLFFLKRPNQSYQRKCGKVVDNPTCLVYQRIYIGGRSKEWSVKRRWNSKRWNQVIGRASDNKEDSKMLNQYLDSLAAKYSRAQKALLDDDKDLTVDTVKDFITKRPERPKMLLEVFGVHNQEMRDTLGKKDGYAPGTITRFETALSHTREFIEWKYKKTDRSIKSLDYDFISDFYNYLNVQRDCAHNTVVKYLTNMKKVVLGCIKRKYLKDDPFVLFPLNIIDIEKPSLTIEELKRLMEKQFSTFRLTFVRDMFVFSCFTGLAYSDVKKLKRSDIVSMDGWKWIILPRTKTRVISKIPILPQAQAILDKYTNLYEVSANDRLIVVRSNQKVNEYLKEIADLCDIFINLTFYTARHTFATLALRYGIPLHIVAMMLGHKKIPQTQHYAIVQQIEAAETMALLPERIENAFASIK